MKNLHKSMFIFVGSLSLSLFSAQAQIVITEVDAAGSSSSTGYAQDWFELTNEGSSAVSISGWKMDDNSDSFSDAVSLNDISSIAAGQSVVFIENDNTPTGDAALEASFEQAWFGSAVPSGFTIGTYGGKGVGLSQTTDEVNIFNSSGTQVTGVEFGASDTTTGTFDNSVLKLGSSVPGADPTISTFSVAGVNGAFDSKTSGEVGSPGAVPEPSALTLVMGSLGLLALGLRRRLVAGL